MLFGPADRKDRRQLARAMALSQIGLEMAGPALLGLGLDYWLQIGPWGVITGAVLGLIGGFAHLIRFVNAEDRAARSQGNDQQQQQQQGGSRP